MFLYSSQGCEPFCLLRSNSNTLELDHRPLLAKAQPTDAETLYQTALRLFLDNRFDQAQTLVELAIGHDNGQSHYHYLLGEIHAESQNSEKAISSLKEAIRLDGNDPDYQYSIANVYYEIKNYRDAIQHFVNALCINPEDDCCHNNLANCYDQCRQPVKAADHYARAIQFAPDNTDYKLNFANFLQTSDRHEKAIDILLDLQKSSPKNSHVKFKLGICYQELGDFAKARSYHAAALELNPTMAIAAFHLAAIVEKEGIDQLTSLCLKGHKMESAPIRKSYWEFALGKLYTKTGEHDKAFHYYHQGNQNKRVTSPYSADTQTAYIDRLIQFFDASFFESVADSGSEIAPIFIVGMPRSGSTLVEQIISRDAGVTSIGENHAMQSLVKELTHEATKKSKYPSCLSGNSAEDYLQLSKRYLTDVEQIYSVKGQTICDKLLGNFLRLGLIAKMFPQAKIIHTARNPLDCCVSAYTQLFENGMYFSYSMEGLANAYQQYNRLMAHWEEFLPMQIHTVRYEDLVSNPEIVTQDLLSFCNLQQASTQDKKSGGDASVPTPVRTASYWQVRQPIYQTSVEKWRRYEQHIQPLIESLGDLSSEGRAA